MSGGGSANAKTIKCLNGVWAAKRMNIQTNECECMQRRIRAITRRICCVDLKNADSCHASAEHVTAAAGAFIVVLCMYVVMTCVVNILLLLLLPLTHFRQWCARHQIMLYAYCTPSCCCCNTGWYFSVFTADAPESAHFSGHVTAEASVSWFVLGVAATAVAVVTAAVRQLLLVNKIKCIRWRVDRKIDLLIKFYDLQQGCAVLCYDIWWHRIMILKTQMSRKILSRWSVISKCLYEGAVRKKLRKGKRNWSNNVFVHLFWLEDI